MKRIRETDPLIVMESARWGDNERPNDPYERDVEWQDELNWLLEDYFPRRSGAVLQQFTSAGLYPAVDAPVFNKHGGTVAQGFRLEMSIPGGTTGDIYYTTNGEDPREYGTGNVAENAFLYTHAHEVNGKTHVKARTLSGTTWSALNEAVFRTPQPYDALKVTEIMYHPPPSQKDPLVNPNLFEFIELQNTGTETIDLSGMKFTRGILYTFTEGQILPPQGFVVLVSDSGMFSSRYPGSSTGGVYTGRLDNDFDTVCLEDLSGETVFSFTYCDGAYWPREPDGEGFSLVPAREPVSDDLNDPANWTVSSHYLGSPGTDDTGVPDRPRFMRGDANADAQVDISDVILTLLFLFGGETAPCEDALDTNDDNTIDISDPVALLSYLFAGDAEPAPPFLQCGFDPGEEDPLGCESFTPCGTK